MRGQPQGKGGGDPKVIPRQFKRKKIFVTNEGRRMKDEWTDRRDSRNSVVDYGNSGYGVLIHCVQN